LRRAGSRGRRHRGVIAASNRRQGTVKVPSIRHALSNLRVKRQQEGLARQGTEVAVNAGRKLRAFGAQSAPTIALRLLRIP
jgi:hypothetical protein